VILRPISLGHNVIAELHAIWRTDNLNPALQEFRNIVVRGV